MKHYEIEWVDVSQIDVDEWTEENCYNCFTEWDEAQAFIKDLIDKGTENIIVGTCYLDDNETGLTEF